MALRALLRAGLARLVLVAAGLGLGSAGPVPAAPGWGFAGAAWAAEGETPRARGLIRSVAEVAVAGELPARIVSMPFREGHVFAEGDVLVAFDCRRIEAEVAGLEADLKAAEATHEGNKALDRHKAIGSRDLIISGAKVERTAADLAAGRARLGDCALRAPFSGVVVETMASAHDLASPSTPLMRIVDREKIEIELIAPSRWLEWLSVGETFRFAVDETGASIEARIVRLAGVVDPVSQTVKVFAVPVLRDERVRPGMSGTAHFAKAGG